ncbi:hypothetical protein [Methylobacterium nigriterrae]|uniref:hypothetical protein n=1 Tax=Methylobacterium nigriterrae TaxID=3127512 RepID=UPI003013E6F7
MPSPTDAQRETARKGHGATSQPRQPWRQSEASDRVAAVIARASESGLFGDKNGRIAGRVSKRLIEQARARAGLTSDTQLIEYALANIAVEDEFAEAFQAVRRTVDPDLQLEL